MKNFKGFRDILNLLKEDYKFDCKIPTCQQLEHNNEKTDLKSKQLTVKQTSETKIVTKVAKKYFFYLGIIYFFNYLSVDLWLKSK